jgi:hypothetical protein
MGEDQGQGLPREDVMAATVELWEVRCQRAWPLWHYSATHIIEIPLTPETAIEDSMPKMELVGSLYPWTVSAFTRRGLLRKIRRWRKLGYGGKVVGL